MLKNLKRTVLILLLLTSISYNCCYADATTVASTSENLLSNIGFIIVAIGFIGLIINFILFLGFKAIIKSKNTTYWDEKKKNIKKILYALVIILLIIGLMDLWMYFKSSIFMFILFIIMAMFLAVIIINAQKRIDTLNEDEDEIEKEINTITRIFYFVGMAISIIVLLYIKYEVKMTMLILFIPVIVFIISIIIRLNKNKNISNIVCEIAIVLVFIILVWSKCIESYNEQFLQYEEYEENNYSENYVTSVNELIKTSIDNNESGRTITIIYEGTNYTSVDELNQLLQKIKINRHYTISAKSYTNLGYIEAITLSLSK
jgi:hypothetical protein